MTLVLFVVLPQNIDDEFSPAIKNLPFHFTNCTQKMLAHYVA